MPPAKTPAKKKPVAKKAPAKKATASKPAARKSTTTATKPARKPVGKKLWGGETDKAVSNFPVSGNTVPMPVIHQLGVIKGAAARANADLGLLSKAKAAKIARAADEIANGQHDGQFPIDVFQTGSGTSSNMNTNEVIATLAGVHPNDDVNLGQSSNDVFPSAVHLAALGQVQQKLLPNLRELERSLTKKSRSFKNHVKSGRTHLMDAVPVTLGQEFGGYAAQIRLGIERIENTLPHVAQIPLGGTATGTGLNTHSRFAQIARKYIQKSTGLKPLPPADPFEAQANRDSLVELSGALKVVAVSLTKIANDLALMGSGPRAGIGEIFLPELQKGSSIMPGKVNPVIPEAVNQVAFEVIGNDLALTLAAEGGQLQLNVMEPLIAYKIFDSIRLLQRAMDMLREHCITGITANVERCHELVEHSIGLVTALNPYIGYENSTRIAKTALESGRGVLELVREEKLLDEATLADILLPENMIAPRLIPLRA